MAISTKSIRESGLERTVRQYFKRGICELASLESLINVQEDSSVDTKIREHIKKASTELNNAEGLIQCVLQKVDSESLEMMALRKKLTDEQKERNEDLATIRAHLEELETLLEKNRVRRKVERAQKEDKRKCQWHIEDEAKRQQKLKSTALWSMLIPVVGTVIVS
uniref:Uncharacterized protein n=1 Tax=Sphaerodactylus townsendi TaxID=933632 RepID=A0ACB8EG10_9SAUR